LAIVIITDSSGLLFGQIIAFTPERLIQAPQWLIRVEFVI